ncbi:MAG: UDP-3-O-(3-hydroxymyristoyl)glucosamine N-acyltransferase, partial [Verrucomicrobiales bacterium]
AQGAEFDPETVSIGALAVVEQGVRIGPGSTVGAGTFVGAGAVIGSDCCIYPNVTIRGCSTLGDRVILHSGVVLGADGFGFEVVDGVREKVEQTGTVRIDDDVEIGANSTVDRARFGSTWIKKGTKLDNQIQVGHNVEIGEHCVIAAQTGIGGSTVFEDEVTCGARVGVADHLRIGKGAMISGASGVTHDLKGAESYLGFPAQPSRIMRRAMVLMRRLPDLYERLKALEKKVGGASRQ